MTANDERVIGSQLDVGAVAAGNQFAFDIAVLTEIEIDRAVDRFEHSGHSEFESGRHVRSGARHVDRRVRTHFAADDRFAARAVRVTEVDDRAGFRSVDRIDAIRRERAVVERQTEQAAIRRAVQNLNLIRARVEELAVLELHLNVGIDGAGRRVVGKRCER